ncbi:Oidioi.mRNA.OKI2018_I69.PAR.g12744.t1.cds [Oikopleura dioica]|uniref:non-specific serine/threonine protein kinase n=1 Tax=Oikopleura dioica TaxID=34765 RepID=A0ABN7S1I9_OIKDI|nr:Oidioi.mRNA.OKI2018_I69.PAR.g12744.t1.cds [Oikopleura dioica]
MELSIAEGQIINIRRSTSKEKVPMFLIKDMLAHGGFGGIYVARDLTRDREIVLKMESHKAKHPQLEIEKEIYSLIYDRKTQFIPHFPMFHRFQQKVKLDFLGENEKKESNLFNLLAIERLGPNLYHILRRSKKRKFHLEENRGKFKEGISLKAVMEIAVQCFECIEFLHEKKVVHRDIKPDNFVVGLIGTSKRSVVHLVDFGLAKKYESKNVFMPKEAKYCTGTDSYMSLHVQASRRNPSLRDDCISLCYTLFELYRGVLWWSKLKIENKKEKVKKIIELKHAQLKQGVQEEFPEMKQIQNILENCYAMAFTEFPNYEMFRTQLRGCTTDYS